MAISQNFPEEGPTLNLNFAGSRTLDPRITFTRTSSATFTGRDGLIKSSPANSARFDHRYNPTTGEVESLGLLVEEARSNVTLQSSRLDANWVINVSGGSGTFIDGEKVTSSVLAVDATYDASISTSSTFTLINSVSGQPFGILTGVTSGATRNITSQINSGGGGNISTFLTTETTAPDGSNTAVLCNPTTSGTQLRFVTRNHTTSTAGTYTYSIFFKNKNISNNQVAIYIGNQTSLSNVVANFNLSTKTFSTVGQNGGWTGSVNYQEYPNGWGRIWVTATTTVSSHTTITGTLWLGGYQGNLETVGSLYVWGAQLEQASFPTSYIPTTTSTVTRTADNASITGSNFSSWYNQSEGTMVAQGKRVINITDSSRIVSFNDNSSSNILSIFLQVNGYQGFKVINGSQNFFAGPTIVNSPINQSKVALSHNTTNATIVTNGVFVGEANISGTALVTRMTIGVEWYLVGYYNGTISQLTYYPSRLPNQILQTLTK